MILFILFISLSQNELFLELIFKILILTYNAIKNTLVSKTIKNEI